MSVNVTDHVQKIQKICSASQEVLDRMTGKSSKEALTDEVVLIIKEAQEEYRQHLLEAWQRVLNPLIEGLTEKLVPKPENPNPLGRIVGRPQIPNIGVIGALEDTIENSDSK
jgi:vacuolar-type H+-ATPase subunit E/Vma4